MKNSKWFSLLLALALVFALACSAFAANNVEPFTDVPLSQYYAEPVAWAVDQQITNGTTATTFSPDMVCTREQIVTLLHRAEGESAAASSVNPFSDVKADSYAIGAILWAVEKEITNGTGNGQFSPGKDCTRGQIVTFLYRTAGEPDVGDVTNPFTDTVKGAYYEKAMLWAVENGITTGMTPTTFEPDRACTRGQAVTFLYRFYHLAQSAYVLMNIPYDEFYAAEGVADVDAVSTSTVKTFNQNMAAGSYHNGYVATDEEVRSSVILGVTYPVLVKDIKVLDGLTEVKADDTATITVAAGKSETTTKEVSGSDLLFASGDHAYYVLDETPNRYKTLTVKDGKFTFSAVNEGAEKAEGLTAEVTYGGHYTDIAFTVSAEELDGVTVNGIIITAKDASGKEAQYALRHVEDIWRITSLGWNWDGLDGKGLAGKTITGVTYYVLDADGAYQIYRYEVNAPVKLQAPAATAEFVDAENITVTGLPADIANPKATVKNQVGRGETATTYAENVAVAKGAVKLTTAADEGKTYAITITSDNYADISVNASYTIPVYVLMNIPYDAFYAAEGVADVDAVSSSTVKTFNQNMAAGSYHDGYIATDEEVQNSVILGVTYPVYVADRTVLADLTEVKAEDEATITVAAGKSATTTKDVTGSDLLFASGTYAYYVLDEAPNRYKTLTVKDGKFTFSAVNEGAEKTTGLTAELTYGGHYTDIAFTVSDAEGANVLSSSVVNGIVLTVKDADGKEAQYALRHVEDIWQKVSLGWNWDGLDGKGLAGKTITGVTYYVKDADGAYQIYRYEVNAPVKLKAGEVTGEFTDAGTVVLKGLPADIANAQATVKNQVGRGETATTYADHVSVANGTVKLTTASEAGKTYVVTVTSDNYADISVTIG